MAGQGLYVVCFMVRGNCMLATGLQQNRVWLTEEPGKGHCSKNLEATEWMLLIGPKEDGGGHNMVVLVSLEKYYLPRPHPRPTESNLLLEEPSNLSPSNLSKFSNRSWCLPNLEGHGRECQTENQVQCVWVESTWCAVNILRWWLRLIDIERLERTWEPQEGV